MSTDRVLFIEYHQISGILPMNDTGPAEMPCIEESVIKTMTKWTRRDRSWIA